MMQQIDAFYSKLAKGEKKLFIVAAILLFIMLLDLLVLNPILSHIRDLDGEIVTKTAASKRNLRIMSFKDGIVKEYSQYVNYMDSGEKSQEEIIAALLHKIETLASQKSVSISNIQPGDIAENPVFKEYKTSLLCEGTLANVLGFMHSLEESDYLFRITKYSLTPKSKGADIMKTSIEMSRVLVAREEMEGVEGMPPPPAVGSEPSNSETPAADITEAKPEEASGTEGEITPNPGTETSAPDPNAGTEPTPPQTGSTPQGNVPNVPATA